MATGAAIRFSPRRLACVAACACLLVAGAATSGPVLIAGGGDTYEPFHFTAGDSATGFDVELLRAVANAADLAVEIRLGDWRRVRAGLDAGEVDIHVGMTYSTERAERYDFSTPHLSRHYRIFVRKGERSLADVEDLRGRRIAVQRAGAMHDHLLDRGYADDLVLAGNAREALGMLASGAVDCCVMSEMRGLHVARELGLRDRLRRVGRPLHQTSYGFAVPAGRRDLLRRLNHGLTLVKATGEYARLYDRWFGVLDPVRVSTWTYLRYASWIILPLLAAFGVAAVWSWTLRRQVRRQTIELRRARDAAEAASEAKSRFLATMSHEIRTPLNGILGVAGILARSDLPPAAREQTAIIDASARALKAIIDDILDFSKIEAEKRRLERVDFDLRTVVADAVGIVAPAARDKGLELRRELGDDLPDLVRGDPTALRQVLLNLLSNAVKFTPRGHVAVRLRATRRDDGLLDLLGEVEDTGVGVPEHARADLFDAFTQADSSSTRRYGGTGLGLAICRDLVELMDGTIRLEDGPAGGSTFVFHVTLEPSPRAAARSDRHGARGGNDGPARVLVAEDNPINQRVLALLLDGWGHEYEIVADGRAAVAAVRDGDFDVVLMDYQMPDTDGVDATIAIRALPGAGARVPVIALTAGASPQDRDRCLSAGMDDFLTKPVDRDRLRATLDRWLARPREPLGV